MRSRILNCSLLLVALAAAAVAAQPYEHRWLKVAPEGEEFAVHMPEPNFRIRRELPFGDGVTLRPASYEITYRGGLFSVLSFSKHEPATPRSLRAFVGGLRHALGRAGVRAEPPAERKPSPDGRGLGELRLAAEGRTGAARVFETQGHFYAVLTLAGAEAEAAAEHFQNSFTFDAAGAGRVPLTQTTEALRSPVKPPAPLWPVAGGGAAVVGTMNGVTRGSVRPMSVSTQPGEENVVSGGVLNRRAVVKPQPAYPAVAKAARASGTVTVQILVDEEGYVIAAEAVGGHPLLRQACVFAARQTHFTPTLLEGRPVKVSGVITYNFILS